MKQTPINAIVVTLFILLFSNISVSLAGEIAGTGNKSIQGTVVNIMAEKGQIEVKNDAGKIVAFTAGPDTDLTVFKKGDQVLIVYGKDQVIQSILKQG